MGIPPAANK
jgi:hypothetical protein